MIIEKESIVNALLISVCFLVQIAVKDCDPRAEAWRSFIPFLPQGHWQMVKQVYIKEDKSGRSNWSTMTIGLPAQNVHRHILLHEVGHIVFGTKKLYGAYADRFWPKGKIKGFTTEYGRMSPTEDAAECYVEAILKRRECGKDRVQWIRTYLNL